MSQRIIAVRSVYALCLALGFVTLFSIQHGRGTSNIGPGFVDIPDTISGRNSALRINETPTEQPVRRYTLSAGESLADLLNQAGISGSDAYAVASALNEITDLRRLRPGQELLVTENSLGEADSIRLPLSLTRVVEARIDASQTWKAVEKWVDVFHVPTVSRAVVETSLYDAAKTAGIPISIMMEAIGLFSFDVDFQRDIHAGDSIVLLREEIQDSAGTVVGAGNLLYARLDLADRSVEAWRYERLDGRVEYYDADGKSTRKALLKTPIDGARISSGFGVRRHPILGYSSLHRGVDFAAVTGTPVLAGGDGVVQLSGWHNDYGNRVKLRHPNHYDTVYAHFSRIAPGIVPGVHVKQGQVIGYVGSTGMSTGPHCHYEVLYYGSPVNPATLKFPPSHSLDSEDLRLYQLERRAMNASFDLK